MPDSPTQPPSALSSAADIPSAPSLVTRLARGIAGQPPLQVTLKSNVSAEINPRLFAQTEEGSGAFGRWILDAFGLPAYAYDMNQRRDVRAYYVNSEGLDRRDHWHQIGNDRLTALASNDGVVQLYLADRGGVILNYFDAYRDDAPKTLTGYIDAFVRLLTRFAGWLYGQWVRLRSHGQISPRIVAADASGQAKTRPAVPSDPNTDGLAVAGGFGYLNDGKQTWATAYRFGPETAKTERQFGMGYYKTTSINQDIHYTRTVYAPPGDDAVLLTDVEIVNNRSTAVDLDYYEYWDVNIHQLQIEWIYTGLAAPAANLRRSLINLGFTQTMSLQTAPVALRLHQEYIPGSLIAEIQKKEVNPAPLDVFLANLNAPSADISIDYYVDKRAFFGAGGVRTPDAVQQHAKSPDQMPALQGISPYCMVLHHRIHLESGAKATLRYGYGAVKAGDSLDFLKKYSADSTLAQTARFWQGQLAYFSTGSDPVLQREMSWHCYNLLSATLRSDRFQTHYTPQGSAYLYLHGADGVPRDQSLFVLPMVYLRPDMARQTMILVMSLRDSDTYALPYAFVGDGAASTALGFHAHPSDLDLFVLLAVAEYVAATGDRAFLQQTIPLYSSESSPTAAISVLDHLRMAYKHLTGEGLGPHNLLHIGDGDWDDAIVLTSVFNPLKTGQVVSLANTIRSGESIPNSQMALYVFPLIAAILEQDDPQLAKDLRSLTDTLKQAVVKEWDPNNRWFRRAYLCGEADQEIMIGDHHLSLQAQIWPLISGLADEMKIESALIEMIKTNLDDPSPTGAMLEPKGQVWPAISQLLTWGYCRRHPDLAWRSLNRHTFAAHATVFPNVWFNIWSGPDGTNSQQAPNPGGTWASPVTPMTDFPVMNANQDAMAWLGLIRICGIEPSTLGDGLDITLKGTPERYVLHTQLLRLDVAPDHLIGDYQAVATGRCTLHIHLPAGAAGINARLRDQPVTGLSPAATQIDLPMTFTTGEHVTFEVRWTR